MDNQEPLSSAQRESGPNEDGYVFGRADYQASARYGKI